jgi:hypothetical protein
MEAEDTETLQNELKTLLDRIDSEAANYKTYLENNQQLTSSLNKML